VPELNSLYHRYKDRAEFFIVYIREAHPIDAWQVGDNVTDDVLVPTTQSDEQRHEVAGVCLTKLGIELPALVDLDDDRVEKAYTGWPDRLYVLDRNGAIAHKSAAGPFGFKPSDVESTLQRLLSN
jgi:Iodothyronine deiodinase